MHNVTTSDVATMNIAWLLGYGIMLAIPVGLIWLFVRRMRNQTARRLILAGSAIAMIVILQIGHAHNITH
jgi:nitrate reductase gamma subunit